MIVSGEGGKQCFGNMNQELVKISVPAGKIHRVMVFENTFRFLMSVL